MVLDPFSRLLTGIAKSLGEGLSRVGQVATQEKQLEQQAALQRRANEESIRLQSIEQIRRDLLSRAQEIQKSAGFSMLPQADQQVFQDMVRNLVSAPQLDATLIGNATGLFSEINRLGRFAETVSELARNGKFAEVGALISGLPDEEAEKRLGYLGFPGLAPTAKSAYEREQARQKVAIRLGEAQAKEYELRNNIIEQTTESTILEAANRARQTGAQADITEEQARTIAERLKAENRLLNQQIARNQIDLANLEREWDLRLEKLATEIGISKATMRQIFANINLIQAQTEQTQAQTQLTQQNVLSLAIRNSVDAATAGYKISKEQSDAIKNLLEVGQRSGLQTEEEYSGLLGTIPGLDPNLVSSLSKNAAVMGVHIKKMAELNLTEKEVDVYLKTLSVANAPGMTLEAGSRVIDSMLGDIANAETRDALKGTLKLTQLLSRTKIRNEIVKSLLEIAPPQTLEQESTYLREIYDGIIAAYGDNDRGRNVANSIAQAARVGWALMRKARTQAEQKEAAQIAQNLAMAAYYRALGTDLGTRRELDKERLALDWAQYAEMVRNNKANNQIAWAQIFASLEKANQAAARRAADGTEDGKKYADEIYRWSTTLKTLQDIYINDFNQEVKRRNPTCVVDSASPSAQIVSEECKSVYEEVSKLPHIANQRASLLASKRTLDDVVGLAIGTEGARQNVPPPPPPSAPGSGSGQNRPGQQQPQQQPQQPLRQPQQQNQNPKQPGSFWPGAPGSATNPLASRYKLTTMDFVNEVMDSFRTPPQTVLPAARGEDNEKDLIIRNFSYSKRFPTAIQMLDGKRPRVDYANLKDGYSAIGFAAALLPTEHVPGQSENNPLQFIDKSFEADLADCRKKAKTPADLAICQGAKQMAKARVVMTPTGGKNKDVKLEGWMTVAAAAKAHTYPYSGMNAPLAANHADANSAPRKFAQTFRDSNQVLAGDWVALNVYNHYLAFADYYQNPMLANIVKGVRQNDINAMNQLAGLSYIIAYMPQKKEKYDAGDVMRTILMLEKMDPPPVYNKPSLDIVNMIAELAEESRISSVGRRISGR